MTVEGTPAYGVAADLPPLARAAVDLADRLGFSHSCAPQQGRLLSVLAGGCAGRHVGETGTGCGVGLAWMVEAAGPSASFVSIEIDAERARAAAEIFRDRPNVDVLHGDWKELRARGPFDLLVLDGGGKGKEPGDEPPLDPTDGWLAEGGTIVLDDFIPVGSPGADAHTAARSYWLEHPALMAIEVRLSRGLATIVGTRRRAPTPA